MQFPPQSSTRVIRMKAIREPWSGSPVYTTDSGFLKSFLEREDSSEPERSKWGAISGLALSIVVSAGFWAGVALLVERVWK